MTTTSETNWDRLKNMGDEDIDTSDIPQLDKEFFSNAQRRIPESRPMTSRPDTDEVIEQASVGSSPSFYARQSDHSTMDSHRHFP